MSASSLLTQSGLDSPPDDETIVIGAGLDMANPESPLAAFYCRTSVVAAMVVFGLLTLLVNYVPLNHTDVWAHLAIGQWIVEHAALPTEEPLTPFAESQGQPLVSSWLAQVIFYLLYSL